ncbi:HAD family hydrolase [Nocardia takedensis]
MIERGIICDIGGTVLETNELHRSAWQQALRTYGLASDVNIGRTEKGLAEGLDSFAIADTMGLEASLSRLLALRKQEIAQSPRVATPNSATTEWLKVQENSVLAAVSHSSEAWSRRMLQLAGILEQFVFVRGRIKTTRVLKAALVADAAAILRQWWSVDSVIYCGDTELDREVARQLGIRYVDAGSL